MLSTLTGILCDCKEARCATLRKNAAFLDFAGFVTMVVLAALSLTGSVQIAHLGCMSSYLLLAGGALGMIILALKYIRSTPPINYSPVERVDMSFD